MKRSDSELAAVQTREQLLCVISSPESRLASKPFEFAVSNEQCRCKEEEQDSGHLQIFRPTKVRGYGSRHVQRDSDRR
jgi:hypothetical protein